MMVLVTGGAGFIGSHTVDLLLRRGYKVRILDSLHPRVHPQGMPAWIPAEVEFISGDVADRTVLESALDGVDRILHLAAYQDYLPDFSTFLHVNAESAALIFEIIVAKRLPVEKVVFASSQAVAGEGRYRCEEHGVMTPPARALEQLERGDWEIHCPRCHRYMQPLLIDEGTVNPGTAYGISKLAIELLAERLGKRYGIPTVCMRYTYVQGPRNSFYNAYSGVARRFALRLMHGLGPVVYEDGRQMRDYVNVSDVASANLLVMERPEADYQVYNVGGGRAVSVLQLVQIMLRVFESDLEPLIPGEFRLGDTRHTVSDISRLRSLGWEPVVPTEQSVAEYVGWLRGQAVTRKYLDEADSIMKAQGVVRQTVRR